jgi:hypothetical protein
MVHKTDQFHLFLSPSWSLCGSTLDASLPRRLERALVTIPGHIRPVLYEHATQASCYIPISVFATILSEDLLDQDLPYPSRASVQLRRSLRPDLDGSFIPSTAEISLCRVRTWRFGGGPGGWPVWPIAKAGHHPRAAACDFGN